MRILRSRRVVGFVFLLLTALFLVRPQVRLLREKVSQSLSLELGRPVEIASVHIRFLPRPELEFQNLVIRDNAGFGAEPLLRSPDVTAWLRVRPLLRGRIEIASLTVSDASLNLTRNQEGTWNFEDLTKPTSRSSSATAASGKGETRQFPYIEGTGARINFKNGQEKTHFAFTNADFALWQASQNEFGMRMRASPIRTDANLTDTGLITVSGVWQRSAKLENTPLQFSFQWKQAQIGQVSNLFYGTDKGWRGSVLISSTLAGTPKNLKITADAFIDDFRRNNVFGGGALRLVGYCTAEYRSVRRALANLDCSAPVGDGSLELKGGATGFPFASYDLSLAAKDVPAQAVLRMIEHVKRNVPEDLIAAGNVNMSFSLGRRDLSEPPQLRGTGEAQDLRLGSQSGGTELLLGSVPFTLVPDASAPRPSPSSLSQTAQQLLIGPVNVAMGRPAPLQAQFSLSRSGYRASVHGEAGIKRLLLAARLLHLPAPQVAAEGSSTVNLVLAGAWGETVPVITGTAQLWSVHAPVRGMNSPLQVHSADLVLDTDSVRVKSLEASAGGTSWRGSLTIPRPCAAPDCGFQFRLRSREIDAAALNQLLNPLAAKRPWYRFLAGGSSKSYLLKAKASGKIVIDKLIFGNAVCNHFSTDLDLQSGKVTLANMRGDMLGGRTAGEWKADFSARPPVYTGNGSFDGASLAAIAGLMHDGWINGSGSASYRFKAAGWGIPDLMDSADISASFLVRDGVFPHVVLAEKSAPLEASLFSGKLTLHEGSFSVGDTKLETVNGVYNISGTAALTGALNLKMTGENSSGYNLSGTLLRTRVSPIPNSPTQAALKP